MGSWQMETPRGWQADTGQADTGQDGSIATAAGTPEIAQSMGELFRFGRCRVAVCRDGLQWLFQRQRPAKEAVGAAWDTLGYCRSREALMRLHRAHTGTDAQELAALPERFKRKGGAA